MQLHSWSSYAGAMRAEDGEVQIELCGDLPPGVEQARLPESIRALFRRLGQPLAELEEKVTERTWPSLEPDCEARLSTVELWDEGRGYRLIERQEEGDWESAGRCHNDAEIVGLPGRVTLRVYGGQGRYFGYRFVGPYSSATQARGAWLAVLGETIGANHVWERDPSVPAEWETTARALPLVPSEIVFLPAIRHGGQPCWLVHRVDARPWAVLLQSRPRESPWRLAPLGPVPAKLEGLYREGLAFQAPRGALPWRELLAAWVGQERTIVVEQDETFSEGRGVLRLRAGAVTLRVSHSATSATAYLQSEDPSWPLGRAQWELSEDRGLVRQTLGVLLMGEPAHLARLSPSVWRWVEARGLRLSDRVERFVEDDLRPSGGLQGAADATARAPRPSGS